MSKWTIPKKEIILSLIMTKLSYIKGTTDKEGKILNKNMTFKRFSIYFKGLTNYFKNPRGEVHLEYQGICPSLVGYEKSYIK